MVDINNISVSDHFGTSYLQITFDVADSYVDLRNYIFNLYRSHVPDTDFTMIAGDIENFEYLDYDVNLFDMYSNYFYKVEVIDRDNQNKKSLSSVYGEYKGHRPDHESATIIHIHDTYLKTTIKNKMILLKRKRFGQICNCYDTIRKRSNPVDCSDCYGTSFFGGYYTPRAIYVNFFNVPGHSESFVYSNVSEEESPLQLWTSNHPLVQPQDILVDIENGRHIVSSAQRTKKNYYILRQILQINKLPKSNIVYNFDLGGYHL